MGSWSKGKDDAGYLDAIIAMGAKAPPTPEPVIDSFIRDVKLKTDQIIARGGQVAFLRPPSQGSLKGEQMASQRQILGKNSHGNRM